MNKQQPKSAIESPQDVFDALFAVHYTAIRRYAERRLPNLATAEDVASDAFAAAWQQLVAGGAVDVPWLYTVASRRIADRYRRGERWAGVEAALQRTAQLPRETLHPLESLALEETLAQLSDTQREAVMLRYWDGLSAAEIGKILGRSEKAIWMSLSRARAQLRSLLDENFTQDNDEKGGVPNAYAKRR